MCTYNGSAFVDAQLHSIARQTRKPDELIVCDDCSTDDTRARVERFSSTAPFPVSLVTSDQTLGATANFNRAISLCTGTLIALADQDDVWEPNKIARLQSEFRNGADVGYVFSDAEVIDSTGALSNYRLWESIGFHRAQQQRFNRGEALPVLARENVVTGATLMFRADLKHLLLPIPLTWVHDGWAAVVLACGSRGVALPEPLVRYRTHASQLIGTSRRTLFRQLETARSMDHAYFARLVDAWTDLRQRVTGLGAVDENSQLLRTIDLKIFHATRRRDMRCGLRATRVALVVSELLAGRYGTFSLGWKSVLQDLFL
jgi:hypothetical protein